MHSCPMMLSVPQAQSSCSAISGTVAFVFMVVASWSQDGCHTSRYQILILGLKKKEW